MIVKESTVVFWGGGRRWLTLKAAANAEAKAKLKTRCECCSGDRITPPTYLGEQEDGVLGWTGNPDRALRFARKEDAELYARLQVLTEPKAVEHCWAGNS